MSGGSAQPSASVALAGDPARIMLYRALSEVGQNLADLYCFAIEQLLSPPGKMVRLVFISYSVRELLNNLPNALAGSRDIDGVTENSTGHGDGLFKRLVASWPYEGGEAASDPISTSDGPPVAGTVDVVAVSAELVHLVTRIVTLHKQGSTNARAKLALTAIGDVAAVDDAVVEVISKVSKFFGDFIHLDRAERRALPDEESIGRHFGLFESVLRSRLGSFFAVAAEIEDLVAQANTATQSEDGTLTFATPDPALVDEALSRIGDLQHRRVFFDGLANPHWVRPLAERRAFTPQDLEEVDGGVRAPMWPAGGYLRRMTDAKPDEVAAALLPCAETSNYLVHRLIVDAAARMPATIASLLVPAITRFLNQPYRRALDERALAATLTTLCRSSTTSKTKIGDLAKALFRPRPLPLPADSPPGRRPEVTSGIDDDYRYREALRLARPALAGLADGRGRRMVAGWLATRQKIAGDDSPEPDSDRSFMWRPLIGETDANSYAHEMGDALVDAVRDNAIEMIDTGTPVETALAELENRSHPLFSRIALFVLATAVRNEASGAVSAGRARLLRAEFLHRTFVYEYINLARALLPFLDEDEQQEYADFITGWPHETDDALREMAAYSGDPAGETRDLELVSEDEIVQVRKILVRNLLATIGENYLPQLLAQRLAVLRAEVGPGGQSLDRPWAVIGPSAPAAPISDEQIDAWSVPETAGFLRIWRPAATDYFGRSPVIAKVSARVARDPQPYADGAESFSELHPAYVYALYAGLAESIKQGRSFTWDPVLRLAATVRQLDLRNRSDDDVPMKLDDYSWRDVLQHIVGLIEIGLIVSGPARLAQGCAPAVFAVLEPLQGAKVPDEDDVRLDDPLTTAINSVRASAVRTLILFVLWAGQHMADQDVQTLRARALACLDERLGHAVDPSLPVAAVWGQLLPDLHEHEETWTVARLHRLLGDPTDALEPSDETAYVDVAWSVFITVHSRLDISTLEHLLPWFAQRVSDLDSDRTEVVGWKARGPGHALAVHILTAQIRGTLDTLTGSASERHELLTELFARGSIELRAGALDDLGWQLFDHKDPLPPMTIDRCTALWDWRMAELAAGRTIATELTGFGWWIASRHFPSDWWLPHLVAILKHTVVPTQPDLGAALAAASVTRPSLTQEALGMMLTPVDTVDWQKRDLLEAAPTIIAAALDCDDPDAQNAAQSLLNDLGRAGHVHMNRSVAEKRAITDDASTLSDGLNPRSDHPGRPPNSRR